MIYLRARYYSPSTGRFLTHDTWGGNPDHPITFNQWTYTKDNPINLTDSSGQLTPDEEIKANEIVEPLAKTYNVIIPKDWGWGTHFDINPCNDIPFVTKIIGWKAGDWRNLHELELTRNAVETLATKMGGSNKFRSAMKGIVTIHRISTELILGHGAYSLNDVLLPNNVFTSDNWAKGQITHELAHVWDTRHWFALSNGMMYATKSYTWHCSTHCIAIYNSSVAIEDAPTEYAKGNAAEDWAESLATFIYSSWGTLRPIRKTYIEKAIHGIP